MKLNWLILMHVAVCFLECLILCDFGYIHQIRLYFAVIIQIIRGLGAHWSVSFV